MFHSIFTHTDRCPALDRIPNGHYDQSGCITGSITIKDSCTAICNTGMLAY